MFTAQSARENRRELAGRSTLNNRKSRHFSQGIRDPLDLLMIDVFRIDHADAGRRLIERNIETCRRDDDRFRFRQLIAVGRYQSWILSKKRWSSTQPQNEKQE